MNKLFYGITVSTEILEIKRLLDFLKTHTDVPIVVQNDMTKETSELNELLKNYDIIRRGIPFDGDFAKFKNFLNASCLSLGADYIFQLDADEMISEYLVKNLPYIINNNLDIDLYVLPRINTVDGITQEHIKKWKWTINEKGYINFPDYQGRIYKSKLKWYKRVHEQIFGMNTITTFPNDEKYCMLHYKTITKQEEQINLYSTM